MLRYTRQIRTNSGGDKMSKPEVEKLKAKMEELKLRVREADNLNEDLEKQADMLIMFYKAIDWNKVDSLTEEQIKNHLKKLKGER